MRLIVLFLSLIVFSYGFCIPVTLPDNSIFHVVSNSGFEHGGLINVSISLDFDESVDEVRIVFPVDADELISLNVSKDFYFFDEGIIVSSPGYLSLSYSLALPSGLHNLVTSFNNVDVITSVRVENVDKSIEVIEGVFEQLPLRIGKPVKWVKGVKLINNNDYLVDYFVLVKGLSDVINTNNGMIIGSRIGWFQSINASESINLLITVSTPAVNRIRSEYDLVEVNDSYSLVYENLTFFNPSNHNYSSIIFESRSGQIDFKVVEGFDYIESNKTNNAVFSYLLRNPLLVLDYEKNGSSFNISSIIVFDYDADSVNLELEINKGYETFYSNIIPVGSLNAGGRLIVSELVDFSLFPEGSYVINARVRDGFGVVSSSDIGFSVEKDSYVNYFFDWVFLGFSLIILFLLIKKFFLRPPQARSF